MSAPYPNDADGEALRLVAESGSDMGSPMVIDFSVRVPDEATGQRLAVLVESLGFDPSIYRDPDNGCWSLNCSKSMLATYAGVVAAQVQLNALVQPHGGACQGWGSFGNASP